MREHRPLLPVCCKSLLEFRSLLCPHLLQGLPLQDEVMGREPWGAFVAVTHD